MTPIVLDIIIEFKIDLDSYQNHLVKNNWTRVPSLTNEKSRWVCAGTSLVDHHSRKRLVMMGTNWANNAFSDALRIVYYKLHGGKNEERI